MKLTTWKCDECGALKKESNHWWLMVVRTDLRINNYAAVWPMLNGLGESPEAMTLCGQACVQRKLAEFMNRAGEQVYG